MSTSRELSEHGLVQVLYTGERKLVRSMDPLERSRVQLTLDSFPERSHQLLMWLDPTTRTPGDPAEEWAQKLIAEALFREEHQ